MDRTANTSDSELISMFLEGDSAAFDTLVRRYERAVFGFILGMVQDETQANDIFQDTFIRIMQALPQYTERGKFASWSLGIARNLSLDALRRRRLETGLFKRQRPGLGEDEECAENVADPGAGPAELVEREDWLERMREALAKLPVEQREVVYLRYESDLTFQQIADLTGVSINTALGRMRYALNALRKGMGIHTESAVDG